MFNYWIYYIGLHILFFIWYIPATIGFIVWRVMDLLVDVIEKIGNLREKK